MICICLVKEQSSPLIISQMKSVQLEHENVTQLVLVSLRDGVEEGRRLSNEEKDPFERIDRGAV